MKIHSDRITHGNIIDATPDGVRVTVDPVGSRKRSQGFIVYAAAVPGVDAYDVKRRYNPTRKIGDAVKAATWQDWGDMIAALFAIDPDAIIGNYNGADDFVDQTIENAYRLTTFQGIDAADEAATRWRSDLWHAINRIEANEGAAA